MTQVADEYNTTRNLYEMCRAYGLHSGEPTELINGWLLLQYKQIGAVMWPLIVHTPIFAPSKPKPVPVVAATIANVLILMSAAVSHYFTHIDAYNTQNTSDEHSAPSALHAPVPSMLHVLVQSAKTIHQFPENLVSAVLLMLPMRLDNAVTQHVLAELCAAFEVPHLLVDVSRETARIVASHQTIIEHVVATEGPAVMHCISDIMDLEDQAEFVNMFYDV